MGITTTSTHKLSIITSTLNAANCIEDTLHSIFPLEIDGVEWVYIDGGSTDGTVSKCSPYTNFVHFYPGCSLYDGFNNGLRHAHGEYVYYLNAGDRILSHNTLRKLLSRLNGKDVYYFNTRVDNDYLFPIQPLDNIYFRMPFSHQGCVMKRTTVDKIGWYNDKCGPAADHELLVRLYIEGCRFEYLSDITLTQCAPWRSTEDAIGRCLNRWRNVRNIMLKYNPNDVLIIDKRYNEMLQRELKKLGLTR